MPLFPAIRDVGLGKKPAHHQTVDYAAIYLGRPTAPHPPTQEGAILYASVDKALRKHAGQNTGIFALAKRQATEIPPQRFRKKRLSSAAPGSATSVRNTDQISCCPSGKAHFARALTKVQQPLQFCGATTPFCSSPGNYSPNGV